MENITKTGSTEIEDDGFITIYPSLVDFASTENQSSTLNVESPVKANDSSGKTEKPE